METWELLDHEVSVTEEGHGFRFRVECRPPCEVTRLLRCYGEGAPKDLLVGVLEPKNGRLFLERKISRETLRQSEAGGVPTRFYLSDGGARERPTAPPPADTAPAEPVKMPEAQATPIPPAKAAGLTGTPSVPCASGVPGALASPIQPAGLPGAPGALASPIQPAGPNGAPGALASPIQPAGLTGVPGAPGAQPPSPTGDPLLDAVLSRGEARSEPSGEGLRITCPFSPVQPFPLAFIAPLCRAEREVAILEWRPGQTPR